MTDDIEIGTIIQITEDNDEYDGLVCRVMVVYARSLKLEVIEGSRKGATFRRFERDNCIPVSPLIQLAMSIGEQEAAE